MTDMLRRLRELEAKATPGPWWRSSVAYSNLISADHPQGRRTVAHPPMPEDSALIAAARSALPLLLDIVELAMATVTQGGRFPLLGPYSMQPGVDPETSPFRFEHKLRLKLAALDNQETT